MLLVRTGLWLPVWGMGVKLTHRLAKPRRVVADLDIAVEENVAVRAADKFEHLYPEHGLWTLAILQDTQGLFIWQHWAAKRKEGRQRSQGGLVVGRFEWILYMPLVFKEQIWTCVMNCNAKKIMQTSCEVFQHSYRFIWVFSALSWVYFIAVLLLTVPNTAWLSRTCTAVELKRIWPLRQESHDQGAESCCLASSLSNKLSYFRFQQRSHKRTKHYLDVWRNNMAGVHMACSFQGFKIPSRDVAWI